MVEKIIIMIRDDLKIILGEELRILAIRTRERLGITQRKMGDILQMSESNYSDIETGAINCCGTLTAILLLGIQDDPLKFIEIINQRFKSWYDKEMRII